MNDLKIWTKDVKDVGTFAFRYPTVKDLIEIARYRSEVYLTGVKFEYDIESKREYPLGIDAHSYYLATVMSELVICSKKIPDGFDFDECEDMEMIIELYEEFFEWRSLFRKSGDTSTNQEGSHEAAQK